jgi:general secretion pathway protein N
MTRFIVTATVILSGAMAAMAAVPSGPSEPTAVDETPGMIRIEDNRAATPAPSGNPLWAIPLKDLSATRDRPIFSPSRRPPAPAVVAGPYKPPPVAKPAEPDTPQLSLVGTIAGGKESFGIFLDRLANTVLRLRTGEQHKGWTLREVRGRETVLEKGDKTATLALPVRSLNTSAGDDDEEKSSRRSRR